MWIKILSNGSEIIENKDRGITWLTSNLEDIIGTRLVCINRSGQTAVSRSLKGHLEYWHSRTAVANQGTHPIIVAERIQGRLPNGNWETITWNGSTFIDSVELKAFGKIKRP